MIRHLCTAHQDLKKKVALVNIMDNKKTALWVALQISRSPSLWPLSPLWMSKDFLRFPRSCKDGHHLQASSANLMLVLKITIRFLSDSHQILIRSTSDSLLDHHQIPIRSLADSHQIPSRYLPNSYQIPTSLDLKGFLRILKEL